MIKQIALDDHGVRQIQAWLLADNTGMKWLGDYNDTVFLESLMTNKNRACYIVEVDEHPIGFFDLDISDGWISFYVEPNSRGNGYSKEIIKQIIDFARYNKLLTLRAGAEEANIASVKALESMLFRKVDMNDGMVNFEKVL